MSRLVPVRETFLNERERERMPKATTRRSRGPRSPSCLLPFGIMRGINRFWQRSNTLSTEPLHDRVGCTWRDSAVSESQHHGGEPAVPHGFVRYRQQMARAGAPLSFRVAAAAYSPLKLCVRFGCLGAVAMSGKFAAGGIVTSSNPLVCGNKSGWWGFSGRKNVDGILREYAGPELARECDVLSPVAPDGQRLLPCTVRATGAHSLKARKVLHAAGPTSPFPRAEGERALRQTYERCFALARDLSLPSLALPAIGCGVAGFPAVVGARAALDAIEEWRLLPEGESASAANDLVLLEFVLADERVYAAFADLAHARYGVKSASDSMLKR